MLKKVLIQIFLIIVIIVISILFYVKYINKSDQTKKVDEIKEEVVELVNVKGNIISDISYETQDIEGRKYLITSQKGIVSKDNPTIIEMEKVNAKIILIDKTFIIIESDFAIYNNVKFDTKFWGNIKVKHPDHLIKSDNLVLSFERNQLDAFNNLTYENLDLIMFADKIEFDFKSKNAKIFNFDKSNVKVQNK